MKGHKFDADLEEFGKEYEHTVLCLQRRPLVAEEGALWLAFHAAYLLKSRGISGV